MNHTDLTLGGAGMVAAGGAITLDIGPNLRQILTPLVAAMVPAVIAWRQARKTRTHVQLTNLEFQRDSGVTTRDQLDRLEAGVNALARRAVSMDATLHDLDRRKHSEHVAFDRRIKNLEDKL